VYYLTSTFFPAHETFMAEAILADDHDATSDGGEQASFEEKGSVKAEVKSVR
jgi:hypothetical protein